MAILVKNGNIVGGGGSSIDIVTSWEETPSDEKVPSEKLVKDSISGLPKSTDVNYIYDNGFASNNIIELGSGNESAIGVTVITNTDGSITFSGTATSDGTFYIVDKICKGSTFAQADKFNLASGGYAMIDGSLTNAKAVVKLTSADNNKILSNTPLKLGGGEYAFAVVINAAGTVSGTIKPMISELSISSYQQYAKSNVELTNKISDGFSKTFTYKELNENREQTTTSTLTGGTLQVIVRNGVCYIYAQSIKISNSGYCMIDITNLGIPRPIPMNVAALGNCDGGTVNGEMWISHDNDTTFTMVFNLKSEQTVFGSASISYPIKDY